jgi:hypothetical protein
MRPARRASQILALSNFCNEARVPHRRWVRNQGGLPVFQIVRCILAENGEVAARQPLQPLFDLWEDATAIAEFDSSRLSGDYGYDEARDCWWASDSSGRMYRFEVEQVAAADVAA